MIFTICKSLLLFAEHKKLASAETAIYSTTSMHTSCLTAILIWTHSIQCKYWTTKERLPVYQWV